MSSRPFLPPPRPDGVPARPDGTWAAVPRRTDHARRGRRADPTLVGVLAIFLTGAIAAAAIAIATPAPTSVGRSDPDGAGQPGIADVVPTGPDAPYAFLAE